MRLLSYTLDFNGETASLTFSPALQSSANELTLEPGVLNAKRHLKVAGHGP